MSTGYYPEGTENDPRAPWNEIFTRTETIEACTCRDCFEPVANDGDLCKGCQAIEAGMCSHCYAFPIMHKDSDCCASCAADAAEYSLSTH